MENLCPQQQKRDICSMPAETQSLNYRETIDLLHQLQIEPQAHVVRLEAKKHKVIGYDQAGEVCWDLRLPLPMPDLKESEQDFHAYIDRIPIAPPDYLLALIQMGASALGYFEEGEVVVHKAIKKYMKRHKRGKAQISYLNTRGKSKAGSRIRLANTIRFFEEINERLTEWEEDYLPERIIYSCTPQLWGLLFQSKVSPPFEKKDPRLVKVPKDVGVPTFEELLAINEFVLKGEFRQMR
ncbi:MAG: hypothetical protein AAF587_18730 [Bacteroidota bacterium]